MLEQPITDGDQIVPALRAFYGDRSRPPVPLRQRVADSRPPRHGFALMGHPPLMLRPARTAAPRPPPELRIVRVTDAPDARPTSSRRSSTAIPAPQLQPFDRVTLFTPATLRRCRAGITSSATSTTGRSPPDRRTSATGCCASRTSRRSTRSAGGATALAITAATIGVDLTKPAALVASDLGRPIYERLGFVAMLRVTYWLGLRELDAEVGGEHDRDAPRGRPRA